MKIRACAAAVVVLASCRAYIGRFGPETAPPPGERADVAFDRRVDSAYRSATLVPVVAGDADLTAFFGADRDACLRAPIALRFAWTSDVQLRQHSVKLFSSRTSRTLDDVIPSFERDAMQELLGWSVHLAHIKALNRYARDLGNASGEAPLSFLIHTGDAVDSGSIEEMYRFVRVTNQSILPWVNVAGNHDTSIFGNYEKNLTYASDAFVDFYPVGRRGFLAMHENERRFSGFGPGLMPVPTGGHVPSQSGMVTLGETANLQTMPPSDCHGFDLPAHDRRDCWRYPGYYAFDVPRAPRVRVIVLDTTKHDEWGADGEFDAAQASWLKEQLVAVRGGTALVFAHHRPMKSVLDAIAAAEHPRVFYFSGHTHESGVYVHAAGRGRVVELNGGSILEYPQLARIVELRETESGRTCVLARAIWPSSFEVVRSFDWARYAENRSRCDVEPIPQMTLERASACGHLGAMADWVHNRNHLLGKPQQPDDAWRATNAVVAQP